MFQKLLLLSSLTWLSVSNQSLQAAPGGLFPFGKAIGPVTQELSLDREQKQKINELRQQRKRDIQPLHEEVKQLREELRLKILGNANPTELRAAHQKLREKRQTLENKQFDLFLETLAILREDQKQKLVDKLDRVEDAAEIKASQNSSQASSTGIR